MQLTSDSGSLSASDDFPVSVFGKEWGIQRTVPGGKYIVNNGTFTSCTHPAYICSNIEFNNSVFYLDRVKIMKIKIIFKQLAVFTSVQVPIGM